MKEDEIIQLRIHFEEETEGSEGYPSDPTYFTGICMIESHFSGSS